MAGLIVHEWLEPSGGAERVVDEFLQVYPDTDLQVLWNDASSRFPKARETWLARTPLRYSKSLALPFMPVTWRHLHSRTQYEWLLVSSHLFAHHARIPGNPDIPKLVYAHTPARYIWEPSLDRRGHHPVVRLASAVLKPLDRRRAREPKAIAANSSFTKRRIENTWGRKARVIYPPVATEILTTVDDWTSSLTTAEIALVKSLPRPFILGASRFVPYKRLELVIEAGKSTNLPVVLAGAGPEYSRLARYAEDRDTPVTIVTSPSDSLLHALMQEALVYVFPAIEDFGIMPVEAMACGTPVIAASEGGAHESVTICGGGVSTRMDAEAPWATLVDAAISVDVHTMRERTSRFSATRFQNELRAWMAEHLSSSPGFRTSPALSSHAAAHE